MKKSKVEWTAKRIVKDIKNGVINFDYPIQREGGQWDNMQQSLLIHSIASDYPVPNIYAITETVDVNGKKKMIYQVLDGKQRLTNIADFVNDKYALNESTPKVVIDDREYEVAGKFFSELDEEVQDAINDFQLTFYKLEDFDDEEIEDLFFRLNNGTPLSKQQQAKGKMGIEWARKIKELVEHSFMKDKSSFTALQIRKADNETALVQSMMLLDNEHELKSISSNDVFKYTLEFKGDDSHKSKLVKEVKDTLDYLDKAFEVQESALLKKVHFPMVIVNANYAMKKGIAPEKFSVWAEDFKKVLRDKKKDRPVIESDYKRYGGAGSVKKDKVLGRVNAMREHMDKFFEQYKEPVSVVKTTETENIEAETTSKRENTDNLAEVIRITDGHKEEIETTTTTEEVLEEVDLIEEELTKFLEDKIK